MKEEAVDASEFGDLVARSVGFLGGFNIRGKCQIVLSGTCEKPTARMPEAST